MPWARSPPCWTWAQYQQQTAACSAELSCFQTADRELVDAFAAFATELRRIEFPAAAQAEAAELGDLADRIAGSPPGAGRRRLARGIPEAGRRQPGTRQHLRPAGTNPWSARYPAKRSFHNVMGWSGMMRGHDDTNHGRATGPRRALGRHRAAAATQATPSQGRPALDPGPSGARRDHLCAAGRGALAAAARQGAGLWQRRDLLAAAARLAAGRRVGGPAPSAAGLAGRRRPGRLV